MYLLFCCKAHSIYTPSLLTDVSRPQDFLLVRLTADVITNKRCLLCCGSVFKQIVNSSICPSFNILMQSISIGDLSRLVLLTIVY